MTVPSVSVGADISIGSYRTIVCTDSARACCAAASLSRPRNDGLGRTVFNGQRVVGKPPFLECVVDSRFFGDSVCLARDAVHSCCLCRCSHSAGARILSHVNCGPGSVGWVSSARGSAVPCWAGQLRLRLNSELARWKDGGVASLGRIGFALRPRHPSVEACCL